MSSMNIKDILPYYIPCRVQVDGKEWGQLIGFSKHDEIEQYLWDILIDGDDDPLTLGMPYNDDFSEDCRVKPVLRPLDSMTEDEALEFIKAQRPFYHHADLEYYAHDVMGVTYRDGTMTMGVLGEPEGEYKVSFYGCSPEGYHWLLSNGFDIFHLIQQGLAIDSNTLTP